MKIMVYNDDDDDDDEGGYWWSFCISILLFKKTLWWAVSTNHFNQTFFIRNVQCLILLYFAQYKINYACRHVSVIYNWFQSGFLLDPSLHSDHLSTPVSITPVLMDCPLYWCHYNCNRWFNWLFLRQPRIDFNYSDGNYFAIACAKFLVWWVHWMRNKCLRLSPFCTFQNLKHRYEMTETLMICQ